MLTRLLSNNRLIHSIKTAIAVFIGFAITGFIHFQIEQWLVISIIVVMCAQMNVGSVLQKSYLRFLGTLIGSLISALTVTLFGAEPVIIAIVVALSALFFSYLATGPRNYSDAGTLGAVTVAIILIGPQPTIITAAERFLEISAGILIAAVVSQFILPIRAGRNLQENQAQTLRLLHDYYVATLLTDTNSKKYEHIDEMIGKSLITQRKLATDAEHEPLGTTFKIKSFKKSLWCEKEILRSITFMYHAYAASNEMQKLFTHSPIIKNFHTQICLVLAQIADGLEKKTMLTSISLPDIQALEETIHAMMKVMPADELIYANSFLFSAQVLLSRLDKLVCLVKENKPL
ncbi:MAG: FUSC family protein [Gammaproteobacteria bacterium]